MVDLHLFLGRPLKMAGKDSQAQDDGLIGSVPQLLVDEEQNFLKRAHDQSHDLVSKINNDYFTGVHCLYNQEHLFGAEIMLGYLSADILSYCVYNPSSIFATRAVLKFGGNKSDIPQF